MHANKVPDSFSQSKELYYVAIQKIKYLFNGKITLSSVETDSD